MKRISSYKKSSPILYLVATPIGNLNEVSSRTLEILSSVDIIACEDTRTSSILLKKYNINKKLIAYHNFNEEESTKGIIELLKANQNVALISDAGYPLLSDPGYELVSKCRELGYAVSTISGPNAAINALVASGFDTKHYLFYGFLNSKDSAKKKELFKLKDFPYTLIFYEAPHRINKTLDALLEVFGKRKVCLARELTKLHEEYIIGTLDELKELENLKGEIVLIVEGCNEVKIFSEDVIFEELVTLVDTGIKVKDACKEIANKYNISKNDLYQKYLHNNKKT